LVDKAEITQTLLNAGFKPHYRGFAYLRDCISLASQNKNLLYALTAELYPVIAKSCGDTPDKVKQGIRLAIATTYRTESFINMFGQYFEKDKKPANGHFIALVTELLELKAAQRRDKPC